MSEQITQVYCNSEDLVNMWLREHPDVEIIDIKLALNDDGELIMVVYREATHEKD